MHRIEVHTRVNAPPSVVFDLARDIEVHTRTASRSRERVIEASRPGKLEPGDRVTFEGRHFGKRWRFTSEITRLESASLFVDEQIAGPFRSFRHEHKFVESEDGTIMVDIVEFSMPIIGAVVAGHLRRFLEERGRQLKEIAEH